MLGADADRGNVAGAARRGRGRAALREPATGDVRAHLGRLARDDLQLTTAEITELRRCKNWTMYFSTTGGGIQQTFVAGMTMSNGFSKVQVSHLAGETIFILSQKGSSKTTDTLHLSKDGNALTQFSPPFRPHTYLRCLPPPKKE